MLLSRDTDNPALIQSYFDSYVPSAGRLFSESMKFGFNTLWMNELLQESRFDEAAKERPIDKTEYKDSRFYRDGINWFDGMTLGQAEIMSENHDRKTYYAQLTKNVNMFSGLGLVSFGGMMAGSLPDPLNFVPFWGIAKNVVRAKKIAGSIQKMKMLQRVKGINKVTPSSEALYSIADPMFGAGLATYFVQDKRMKFQEEWDMKMVMMDALIAGGLGFSMWSIGKVARKLKKSPINERIDRSARGSEQIEEAPFGGPNLKPDGGAGGMNYAIPASRGINTSVGIITLNGTVSVSERIYAVVDSINVKTSEESLIAINEALDVMNAEGFDGLHISDNLDANQLNNIVENLDMTSMKLETRPDSNGHTIERIQDEANWNHVRRDQEPLADPDQEAEIAMAKDSQAEADYNASFETDETFTTNMNRMSESETISADAQRIRDGVNQAASCVTKNG
jgi:hypothetical protein